MRHSGAVTNCPAHIKEALMIDPTPQATEQAAAAEAAAESRDETIIVRLQSGDRYRFEDGEGRELCLVEIASPEDATNWPSTPSALQASS